MKGEPERMDDNQLQFYTLCGPIEDAIELIDAGRTDAAKALLERILERARIMTKTQDR